LLESELRRALETASSEDGAICGGSGGFFEDLGELWGCLDGRLDSGGNGRRGVCRGTCGNALHLGFDVANPARSKDPVGRKARGCILNGSMRCNGCRSVKKASFEGTTAFLALTE